MVGRKKLNAFINFRVVVEFGGVNQGGSNIYMDEMERHRVSPGSRRISRPIRSREIMNGHLPRLLTIAEVANCLRMSKSQVYLMVAKKTLPYIRLSERRIVVSEDDLIAFIQRQRAMEPSQLIFMLDRILDHKD